MPIELTEEQQKTLEEEHAAPPRVLNPRTKETFVLLRADLYERVKPLLEKDDLDPEDMAPLLWEVMKEDWDDPAMDVYDHYPEKQP